MREAEGVVYSISSLPMKRMKEVEDDEDDEEYEEETFIPSSSHREAEGAVQLLSSLQQYIPTLNQMEISDRTEDDQPAIPSPYPSPISTSHVPLRSLPLSSDEPASPPCKLPSHRYLQTPLKSQPHSTTIIRARHTDIHTTITAVRTSQKHCCMHACVLNSPPAPLYQDVLAGACPSCPGTSRCSLGDCSHVRLLGVVHGAKQGQACVQL